MGFCSACVVAARRRTTSRWSARTRCAAAAPCTGLRVDTTTTARPTTPSCTTSRCPVCSARTRPAGAVCPVRHQPLQRRPQRHGSKPLRGHAATAPITARKSARFNFYQYSDYQTPSLSCWHNPDVTRAQPGRDGEMHLMRASASTAPRSTPEKQNRKVRDGEIQTACQATCSTPGDYLGISTIPPAASRDEKRKS